MKTRSISRQLLQKFLPTGLALLIGCIPFSVSADSSPAITVISSGTQNSIPDYVVGWSFQTTVDVTVTHLGIFDVNGNGTLDEPQAPSVGIWNASQSLLVSTNVPLSATNDNGFFYVPIDPVELAAGQTYVIGTVNYQNGERFWYDATLQAHPYVQWGEGRFKAGGTLAYPDGVRTHAQPSYFGPSFKFNTTSEMPASISISLPTTRTVHQRNNTNYASVTVSGTYWGEIDTVKATVTPRDGYSGTATSQTILDPAPTNQAFSGSLQVKAGWYDIEVIGFLDGQPISTGTVQRVGVGEVVITCGQSNSANYGSPKQTPSDDRISCSDMSTWRHAADSQPIAGGTGGSPWPAFGDKLAEYLDVPIGIISLGVGSTRVDQWIPGTAYYTRIKNALAFLEPNGCRAILWHQGESDSLNATSTALYKQRLESIISQSRIDCGRSLLWGVAIASWHPNSSAANEANITNAQWQVITNDPLTFKGAETDDFHNLDYLSDSVHFNTTGLTNHGNQWAAAVRKESFPKPSAPCKLTGAAFGTSNAVIITWNTETNITYQVQTTHSLTNNPLVWTNAGGWHAGSVTSMSYTFENMSSEQKFFRIIMPHTDY